MDRSSQQRIWKVENLISAAKKEREEKRRKRDENYLLHARFHATTVAAIVLSGEPKIDEPLIRAWTRALQHYGIRVQQYGMNLDEAARTRDQVAAAQRLFPIIVGGAEVSAKFTEIFRTAPVWLLDFTSTFMDAGLLSFDLPPKSWRPKWGSGGEYKWGTAGYEESRRWPLLPLGTMTDGDPIPEGQMPPWPFPLDMMEKPDPIPDIQEDPPQEDEDIPSPEADLMEDMKLFTDVAENPGREKELSRYEKLRLRNVFRYLSSRRRQRSGED